MLRNNDGKHHLLHFIADAVRSRFKDSLRFLEDLKDVEAASQKDALWLASEATKLQSGVRRVGNEVKKQHFAANDKFVPVMSEFHGKAQPNTQALVAESKKIAEATRRLCKAYGEKSSVKPGELLAKFAVFTRDFRAALSAIDKEVADKADHERRQKLLAERKEKQALEKKRRARERDRDAKKTTKRGLSPMAIRNNDIVDAVVNDLTKFSAKDMLRKFKKKRMKSSMLKSNNAPSKKADPSRLQVPMKQRC
mmetsp:Transcript_17382/g.24186  ORF Transcript_17382/g.24186 Transcript_17382/m.24186 type:complete len:252 (+) Transcript_17382:2-757(+)|eukprot:jgi/Bigna1/71574/fgenesh1_pg.16_\